MRARDFAKENIEPIQPVATNKNTATQTPQAGSANALPTNMDQAIGQVDQAAAAKQPGKIATAYNKLTAPVAGVDPNSITQSKLGSALGNALGAPAKLAMKALNSKTASRFAAGFKAGAQSGIGPGHDPITAPGAAVRADAAALEPLKYAWNVYSKQITPADVPSQYYNKVNSVLRSPPADWAEALTKNQIPASLKGARVTAPGQNIIHSSNAPVDPQVANYLRQASRGQKVKATNNPELDKILKAAGILQ